MAKEKEKRAKNNFISFPQDFFWGSATSSYQVEGGNVNDWSQWEVKNAQLLAESAKKTYKVWQGQKFPQMFKASNYICGKACNHYNRFREDFDLAKSLNQNAHRFSLEWSRVEPEEGKFNKKEIKHYKRVLIALRKRGIEPFVTLKHFTNPLWLTEKGGTASSNYPYFFARYVKKVIQELGKFCQYWITVNEPTVIISKAYFNSSWPGDKSFYKAFKYFYMTVKAHSLAYDCIKKELPQAKVGVSHLFSFWSPAKENSFLDKMAAKLTRYFANEKFINKIKSKLDFIGVNYYFHTRVKFFSQSLGADKKKNKFSDLNWEIYPKGIYEVLKEIKKYNLPIYITENGVADADDKFRDNFIKEHLFWIKKAMQEKILVKGYFHWSLMDNFEWDKGFWPRFGLIEIDYKTLERKIRASGKEYAKICATNKFKINSQ
jgi:beta-glucosidase